MPYYYPHAFRHFLNRYFCALCRHHFRVISGGFCDHVGSPCLVSSSISSRNNSVCFFIVFRNIAASCSPIAANARRLGHIPEYFLLGCTMYPALKVTVPSRRNVYWAFAACLLVSLADQTLKALIPVRHFDLLDLPVDLLGYGAGILLSWGVWKKWRENE